MKFPLPIILILQFAIVASAQDGTIDQNFNSNDIGYFNGDGANGLVNATTVLSNGKIVIGGQFQYYNGSSQIGLVRLFGDGRLDTSFNKGGLGISGFSVNAVKELPDGKLLIAGSFSKYNNFSRRMIARLNSDGSLDTSFNSNVLISGNAINSIAVQPDGRIIIAGDFTLAGKQNWLSRLLPNGRLDSSFQPGYGQWGGNMMAIGIQSTGKIIVGGAFATDSFPKKYFCRFDSTGKLDTSFHTGMGPNDYVSTLQVLLDDRIIIGGKFSAFNGVLRRCVARLLPDGSLDTDFAPALQLTQPVLALALNNSGKLLLGGLFNNIYRLNSDGSRDSLFNPDAAVNGYVTTGPSGSAFNAVYSLSVQIDGRYIVGGQFNLFGEVTNNHVMRITGEGYRDSSFNPGRGANHGIYALKVQGDRKILIAGTFTAFNDKTVNGIARLQPDGTIDSSFNKNGAGFKNEAATNGIYSMELQSDGKILIGGDFLKFNGTPVHNVTRLQADGTIDKSFFPGAGPAGLVLALAAQQDDKIMVGGTFKLFNSKSNIGIVRLNSDGSIDPSFISKFGTDLVEVSHITIQPDGKYLVSGIFHTYAGLTRQYLVRLSSNGDFDPSFNMGTGTNDEVVGTVVQPDGKILVSGKFSSYNNTAVSGLIRLKPDGALDSSFITGRSGMLYSLSCLLPDGKIITGVYNYSGDTAILVRLLPNGIVDTTFVRGGGSKSGPGLDFRGYNIGFGVQGLSPALQPDGKILVYGLFWSYDGIGRNRLALINNHTTSLLTIGAIMPLSICAGSNINIPFNSIALTPSTLITAQLSDSTGSFSNPLVIGTSTGLSSGLLSGFIAPDVAAGAGYRIRLVSSLPAILSTDNGTNIRINAFASNPTWIGAYSTSWNDVRNWCGGIPSAATDVIIPSATPFNPIVSSGAQARNIIVNAGGTLGMDASSFLNLYGNINNSGVLATDNGQIQFRGTAKQNIPTMTVSRIVLNGTGGVVLNGNLSVTQSITFTQGNLMLSAYDLSFKGINFGSKTSHIITSGAGSAVSSDGASANIAFFPIGADSVSYNPVTINGTGGKNFFTRVNNALPSSVINPSKAVNRTWHVVPAATLSFPATIDVQFADSEGNTLYSPANSFEAGINNANSWKIIGSGITLSGGASSRHVTLNTSDFGDIVIGNQGTIQTPLAVSSVDADSAYAELIPSLVTSNEVELKLNVQRATLVNCTIITSTGITVYQFSKRVIAGENLIPISLPNLSAGAYLLIGRLSSGKVVSIRFVRL